MKNIIFCLLFASFSAYAQNPKTVNIWDFEYENLEVSQGDSTWLTFKYTGLTIEDKDTIVFSIQHINADLTSSNLLVVYKKGIEFIDAIPKEENGTTKIKIKIPDNYKIGKAKVLSTKHGSTAIPARRPDFTITQKVVSGLFNPTYKENEVYKYYNIQGLEIQKPTEGLFIWRSENGTSGKVYIY